MNKKLTVVDFFAGAGGFSEGFKQAGFDVIYATDNWGPAVDTFKFNNPDTETIKADVLTLDASDVPHADVIIGGPPCTEFSGSEEGWWWRFQEGAYIGIEIFVLFLDSLKPRWWIMENVPRLMQALPNRFKLKDIGINKEGYFDIPKLQIFNSADFGAPQKRLRLFSGVYPNPIQTHSENPTVNLFGDRYQKWISMRHVIESYPNPLGRPKTSSLVENPNYNIKIEEKELRRPLWKIFGHE